MKRIGALVILLLIFIPYRIGWTYGIVTATPTRDTISIPFCVLDSMGKAVDLASGDSLYLVVFSPGGSVVYKDSMAYNNTRVKNYDWNAFNGGMSYVLSVRVDSINGTSTAKGVFTYVLTVDDNTGADLTNTFMGQFQIIDTTLDQSLNKIKAMLDTLLKVQDSTEAYDDWMADSSRIDRIMAKVSQDSSFAKTGTSRIWALRGLHVRGTTTGDTAIIADANNGDNSRGFFIRGGNAALQCMATGTTLGIGILGQGSNSGGGMQLVGGSAGDGLLANGFGTNHAGIRAIGYSGSGAVSIMADNGIWAPTITGNLIGRVDSLGDGGIKAFWNKPFSTSFTAGSMGDSLTNATYVQGNAAGLDSAIVQRIANRNLDSAQSITDTVSSGGYLMTLGDSLSCRDGSSLGSGSYPVTITVVDSSSAQVVPGARISVRNLSLTALVALGATGMSGQVQFNLDTGLYILSVLAPGYIFAAYDTVWVNEASYDSVIGSHFDPGSPASADLCRVYGFVYDINGVPLEGVQIMAQLTEGVVRHGTTIISPYMQSVLSDTAGYFYMDLIPSEVLTPTGMKYLISVTYPAGTILKKKIEVPDMATWQLTW